MPHRPRPQRSTLPGLFAMLAAACTASAQSVLFISPDRPVAASGESVIISAARFDAAAAAPALAPAPWPADRIAWMFLRAGATQANSEPGAPAAAPGRTGPAFTLDVPDAAMIGLDLAPRDEDLAGRALVQWAKSAIAPALLPANLDTLAGTKTVAVRRVESAKTLVRARGPGERLRTDLASPRPIRSATSADKSGQAVEIRPLFDVTAAVTPTDMPVRMYAFGDGAKRALLRVVHVDTGDEQRLPADDKAIAWVRLERPGAYRMEFHALAPFTPPEGDPSPARWTLHSATVTFTVPPNPPPPAPHQQPETNTPARAKEGAR